MPAPRLAAPARAHLFSYRVKRLRIGVLYGGRSSEHEVSVASAAAIFAHIDRQRFDPIAIRIEKDGRWTLADRPPSAPSAAHVIDQMRSDVPRHRPGREVAVPPHPGSDSLLLIDRARGQSDAADSSAAVTGLALDAIFPVLHGPFGEDGTVQGLLELMGIAYVGCGVLASAVGLDKAVMKSVFRAHGLRVTNWQLVTRHAWQTNADTVVRQIESSLAYPLFVKPANMGSSIGISRVDAPSALASAIDLALSYDRKVIVEVAVPDAREIECAVLGNDTPETSMPGEIASSRAFYDYDAKYLDGQSTTTIPAHLDPEVVDQIRAQSIAAFQCIDGAGLARVDFLLARHTGDLYVNEINTLPGFTTISMYAKLWAASGLDTTMLIDRLIALALERHSDRQQRRTSAF
jgi:D-alanine-D-alanine ligase